MPVLRFWPVISIAAMVSKVRVVGLVALGLLACSAPRSERCKKICEREAECAEAVADRDFKFDQRECVAACTALERDDESRAIVEAHAECVRRAGNDCVKVYECQ